MNKAANRIIKTRRVAFTHFVGKPTEEKYRADGDDQSDQQLQTEREPQTADEFINRRKSLFIKDIYSGNETGKICRRKILAAFWRGKKSCGIF